MEGREFGGEEIFYPVEGMFDAKGYRWALHFECD